jgi:hypothetical protein
MQNDIGNRIINIMKNDNRRDYTIPEIMTALGMKNREKTVAAMARLEGSNTIELSREKGRTKYYRLNGNLI